MTLPTDAPRSSPPSSGPDGRVSTAVIETIAAEAERDPIELPPLFDTVDPDALDALFSNQPDGTPRQVGAVEFPYAGYHVRVTADQTVEVTPGADRG